jgi:hypothetical protein
MPRACEGKHSRGAGGERATRGRCAVAGRGKFCARAATESPSGRAPVKPRGGGSGGPGGPGCRGGGGGVGRRGTQSVLGLSAERDAHDPQMSGAAEVVDGARLVAAGLA